jgi:DNA-3-methyladenine glycosylase II
MKTIEIKKPHGFALRAASEFYAAFTPGSGMAVASASHLTLGFRLDQSYEPVAVALREEGDVIVADVVGSTDQSKVQQQLARILGLEHNGEAWLEVGRRDRVVGRLQRAFPGFFTAAKSSPYDAATWGMIAPRLPMRVAAKLKLSMARTLGDAVEIHGRALHVFPSPRALGKVESFPGLSDEKMSRLRGIAAAAQSGLLDAERLRTLPEYEALAQLQTLRGVGPWVASHIYYRGAAPTDGLPSAEPRVLHGLAHAYGLPTATQAQFAQLAETWRPFRMWVTILLMRHLSRTGDWHAPTLARERAEAGRKLAQQTALRGERARRSA